MDNTNIENLTITYNDNLLIIEALQLLIDYKNHGITKNKEISDLLEYLEFYNK